jgi:hypothetical protein
MIMDERKGTPPSAETWLCWYRSSGALAYCQQHPQLPLRQHVVPIVQQSLTAVALLHYCTLHICCLGCN